MISSSKESTEKVIRSAGHLTKPRAESRLAQLGEHLPYKQGVIGSIPISPILNLNQKIIKLVLGPIV